MRTRVLAGFSRARRVLSFPSSLSLSLSLNDSCRFKARRTRACEWEMARGESSRTVLRPSLALSKRRLNASNLDRKPRSGEEITSSAYSADNMFGHIYIYIYMFTFYYAHHIFCTIRMWARGCTGYLNRVRLGAFKLNQFMRRMKAISLDVPFPVPSVPLDAIVRGSRINNRYGVADSDCLTFYICATSRVTGQRRLRIPDRFPAPARAEVPPPGAEGRGVI
jgi:hypothetical protein